MHYTLSPLLRRCGRRPGFGHLCKRSFADTLLICKSGPHIGIFRIAMAPKAQKTALAGGLIESHTRFHCREGKSATRGRLLLDPKRFSGQASAPGSPS